MKFGKYKVAFGRHESFHLRFGWLPKGFSGLQRDPGLAADGDRGTVVLARILHE